MHVVRISVLPMMAGMLILRDYPAAAAKMARWLRPTAFVVLVVVIGTSVLVSAEMVLRNLVAATPAIYALNITAMAFGLLLGRLIGASSRDAMTLSIETGVQNVTLAIFLTLNVLGSLPLAVTQNIYGVVMLINASLLIRWWRRRIAAEAPEAP